MRHFISVVAAFGLLFAGANAQTSAPQTGPAVSQSTVAFGPKIAVLDFSTKGLTSSWYGQFEPGIALADLVTDQLVNSGKYHVLDRQNLEQVMNEHNLSKAGEVSGATAIASGKLIGARFLITGNIMQLEKTGDSGGIGGAFLGGLTGGLGAVKTERVTLKVQVRIIDAQTGEIVQSYADEQTQKGTSWGAAGFGGSGGGAYGNSQFVNSTIGHLVNDEAARIAQKFDPTALSTHAAVANVSGRIVDNSGGVIIINVGSAKGVVEGMAFNVVRLRQFKDPDNPGKFMTVRVSTGTIEITTVSNDTAQGKLTSGSADAGAYVESSQ